MRYKNVVAILLITVMALGVFACAPPEEVEPEEPVDPEEPEEPEEPKELILASGMEPGDISPLVGLYLSSCWVAANIHDTLVTKGQRTGPDGYLVEDPDDPQPGLAHDWDVSDDYLTYTFHLRDDVDFHDGSHFTAEDVAFSFDLIMNEGGAADRYGAMIDEVEVVDDYTVKFHLNDVEPMFVQQLSTYHSSILSKEALLREAGDDVEDQMEWLGTNAIGTGPYMLGEKLPDEVRLEANPDYWGGEPDIDVVYIKEVPEESTRRVLLEKGDIDINYDPGDVNYDALDADPEIELMVRPSTTRIWYVGLNMQKPPFDDIKVRKAIAHALPYNDILNVVHGGQEYAPRARSILTSDLPSYVPVYDYEYDLDRAQELLAEAGYEEGDLQLVWSSTGAGEEIGVMLQSELEKIGVELEVDVQSGSVYFPAGREGEHEMFYVSWWSGIGCPVNLLDGIAHSGQFGGGNWARFVDPQVDQWLEAASVEMDPDQRNEYLEKIQRELAEQLPYAVVSEGAVVYAMSQNVQGYVHYSDNLVRFIDLKLTD